MINIPVMLYGATLHRQIVQNGIQGGRTLRIVCSLNSVQERVILLGWLDTPVLDRSLFIESPNVVAMHTTHSHYAPWFIDRALIYLLGDPPSKYFHRSPAFIKCISRAVMGNKCSAHVLPQGQSLPI